MTSRESGQADPRPASLLAFFFSLITYHLQLSFLSFRGQEVSVAATSRLTEGASLTLHTMHHELGGAFLLVMVVTPGRSNGAQRRGLGGLDRRWFCSAWISRYGSS